MSGRFVSVRHGRLGLTWLGLASRVLFRGCLGVFDSFVEEISLTSGVQMFPAAHCLSSSKLSNPALDCRPLLAFCSRRCTGGRLVHPLVAPRHAGSVLRCGPRTLLGVFECLGAHEPSAAARRLWRSHLPDVDRSLPPVPPRVLCSLSAILLYLALVAGGEKQDSRRGRGATQCFEEKAKVQPQVRLQALPYLRRLAGGALVPLRPRDIEYARKIL